MQINYCKTRTAEIFIDERQIVHVKVIQGSEIDELDAMDNFLVIKNVSNNNPALKLIDVTGAWKMNRKAKQFSKKQISAANTIARAFLVDSLLNKWVSNLFKSFASEKIPQQFFTNKEEAIEWLLQFKIE